MAKIIDNRNSLDKTIRIYDNFYSIDLVVDAAQYDIVYSFFSGISESKQVAQNFTAFLFRISQETGINVLDLVAQLKGTQNKMQLNKVISYYLNSFKSKISMYGVGTIPKPNLPVARNIVI